MKTRQQGFTIVELITVIVILGILAATALPKFINVTVQARVAAVNGVAGGLRSAVSVVQAGYQAAGVTTATTATMADSTTVTVTAGSGLATGAFAGIGSAMRCETAALCGGMATTYGANSTFTAAGATTPGTCQATYIAATGAVSVNVTNCT